MNWLDVVSSLLAFIIFLFFLTTLLYFVQYQMQKAQRLRAQFVHPLEGRFLQRYVPLELKAKYEQQIQSQKSEIERKRRRWWFQGPAVLFFCLISMRAAGQGTSAAGNELAIIQSAIEFDSTSDELEKTSLTAGYRNHRREPLWPYAQEASRSWDWGVTAEHHQGRMADRSRFSGTKFGVVVAQKYSERAYFEAGLFVHHLESDVHSVKSSRLAAHGKVALNPTDKIWLTLHGRNDFVYQEMFLPAGVTQGLTTTAVRLDLVFRPHEKWRVLGKTGQNWFSDGNRREDHELAAMYGLAPTTPWIWLGLGVNYLGYRFSQPDLWTPHHFLAYGPRLDVAVPIGPSLLAVMEFGYNVSREESFETSQGYSVAAGVRYGDRNDLQVTGLVRRIDTDLRNEGWSSHGGMLSASYSF